MGEYARRHYGHDDGSIKLNIAAQHTGRLLAGASSSIFRVALEKRAAYLDAQESTPEGKPRTVAEIVAEGEVEDLLRIGMRSAALRLDEFSDNIRFYIDTTETGELDFHRDRMTPTRDLKQPETNPKLRAPVLHNKRLRCPAMFVEGFMKVMLGVTREIVLEADRLAVEEEAKREKYRTYMNRSFGVPRSRLYEHHHLLLVIKLIHTAKSKTHHFIGSSAFC